MSVNFQQKCRHLSVNIPITFQQIPTFAESYGYDSKQYLTAVKRVNKRIANITVVYKSFVCGPYKQPEPNERKTSRNESYRVRTSQCAAGFQSKWLQETSPDLKMTTPPLR